MYAPEVTTIDMLLERYDTLLLDAYGVLIDKQGPLPGAAQLIDTLNSTHQSYLLLTNSASRLPEVMASDLQQMGLSIPGEKILSSGTLLESIFHERQLRGTRCLVLGPADAREYVRRAGGEAFAPGQGVDAEVVVIADQKGFDLQSGLDETLSLLLNRFDRQQHTELLLCNPDLIYPVDKRHFGFTSGALGAMLNHIFVERYGIKAPRFEPLGKPHPPLFQAAADQTEGRMIMLGDQLATDILGAKRFGIDAALVLTGVARPNLDDQAILPDYILHSLVPE